ncbi:MAG: L,D-transpeptidase [Candidatus Gracilibacteria bacterium]|nr:L,D-transpeptidase [Candidatus Gracilibacteria bacterium]
MNYPSVFSLIRRHSLPSLGGDYSRDIRGIVESLHERLIVIFGSTNTLIYFENGKPLFQTECVTSKEGFGNEPDSHRTPTGLHRVVDRIGDGCDKYQKFKARVPTTIDTPPKPGKLKFGTYGRILTLDGVETINQSTKSRYVYIHGNINESYWQEPEKNLRRSWGCIGLKLDEMVELFDLVKLVKAVKEQVFVYIIGDESSGMKGK